MDYFKQYGAALFLMVSGLLGAWILSITFPPQPLNIIVISLDSVRADHLDLFGYSRQTMPALSAWAKDSAFIFTNYFASSYLTPISEVSVQTGESPFTTGVVNFAATARPTVPFLAELLKEHGYDTAAFGSSPEYLINSALNATFSRGFDTFDPYPTTIPATKPGQSRVNGRTLSKPIDDAVSWLDGRKDSKAPFYLWLPLGSAHAPYFLGKPIHFTAPAYAR
jgi:choline-sulfatase